MVVVKRDWSVATRHLVETTIWGAVFLACLAVGMSGWLPEKSWYWPFVIGIGALCVGGVLDRRRFRRFRCPTCKRDLKRDPNADSSEVKFLCADCDTVWDTGMRV